MAAPARTKVGELVYTPGAGLDLVVEAGAADDDVRIWVDGDLFPRIVIDANAGQILLGGGKAAPATVGALSIASFGAVGDGVTDDTVAIRAAIAWAQLGGVRVFVPPKNFVTQPLTLPPGVILEGLNAQAYYNATPTVPNVSTQSRLKLKAGSSGALISPDDTGTNLATAVQVRDIALDCNGINQPAINLPDLGSSISRFWLMERIYVTNVNSGNVASGSAVYIGNNNTACTMRDAVIFNGTSGSPAGYDGLTWYGSDGRADNVYVGYFAHIGLSCLGGANDETLVWRGGGLFTCSTGAVVGGTGVVFEGTSFDHCSADGVFVGFSCVFTDCTFHNNSTVGNGSNSNVTIAGNNCTVTMTGCRAALRDTGVNDPAYHINVTGSNVTLNEFGSINEGATFTVGWTNYARVLKTDLGSDTALTADASTHALLTTPTLGVGLWMVTANVSCENTSTATSFWDFGIQLGTAVGSIVGPACGMISYPTATTFQFECNTITMTAFVTVTTAGTVVVNYSSHVAGGGTTAKKNGVQTNLGIATGISAVRIG